MEDNNKIIFREKEFSDKATATRYLISGTEEMLYELIKFVDFYYDSKKSGWDDTDHWIEQLATRLTKIENSPIEVYHFFIGVWPKSTITKVLGTDGYFLDYNAKFPTPEKYVESGKQCILNSKQYTKWVKSLKDFKYSNEAYIDIIRYLSLVLSGQVEPGTFDSGNWKLMTLDTNRNTVSIVKNPIEFKKLLKSVLMEAAYIYD